MTSAHFIYMPALVLLGIVIGYVLGGRAAEGARSAGEHRDKRREARKARRERGEPRDTG